MQPRQQALRLYGQPSERTELAWEWAADQLRSAGTYWVIANSSGHPHPRPVWGLWHDDALHLSLGSPALNAALAADPRVTVHLGSGTEVVIVEGSVAPDAPTTAGALAAYRSKYDWDYDVAAYGELKLVVVSRILAWIAAGWAGRESFAATGRWTFDST